MIVYHVVWERPSSRSGTSSSTCFSLVPLWTDKPFAKRRRGAHAGTVGLQKKCQTVREKLAVLGVRPAVFTPAEASAPLSSGAGTSTYFGEGCFGRLIRLLASQPKPDLAREDRPLPFPSRSTVRKGGSLPS